MKDFPGAFLKFVQIHGTETEGTEQDTWVETAVTGASVSHTTKLRLCLGQK